MPAMKKSVRPAKLLDCALLIAMGIGAEVTRAIRGGQRNPPTLLSLCADHHSVRKFIARTSLEPPYVGAPTCFG